MLKGTRMTISSLVDILLSPGSRSSNSSVRRSHDAGGWHECWDSIRRRLAQRQTLNAAKAPIDEFAIALGSLLEADAPEFDRSSA
jgi:hypothetical protein